MHAKILLGTGSKEVGASSLSVFVFDIIEARKRQLLPKQSRFSILHLIVIKMNSSMITISPFVREVEILYEI